MSEIFLRWCGPGMLGGITFGDWIQLLRENRCRVAFRSLIRATGITCQSIQNSICRWLEHRRYSTAIENITVMSPTFIIGHWRSGTTHLHNLMTIDQRFGFPNNYQAFFPHAFLTMEALHAWFVEWFLPARRPMDNIEWNMKSPQEDEIALSILTFKSSYIGWSFPRRQQHYDRYLTFRNVEEREIDAWKAGLSAFLKKLTWKSQRPLILKSPPHTCRIKHLLEMFPDARFIHIHRNPYDVFQSTRKMLTINFQMHCLQHPPGEELNDWILQQYREMYDVFFEERGLIPAGQYHEVRFEELERDPVGQLQQVYATLNLPPFSEAKAAVEEYASTLSDYRKNEFPDLSSELRERIATEWQDAFQLWGYSA